jgi:hypothetical protein
MTVYQTKELTANTDMDNHTSECKKQECVKEILKEIKQKQMES